MSNLGDKAPLLNDPAREATASMYGYASQIWRSVLIWLRLQTTERMYLEGAEDIDVIHGAGVQTTQVKATTENITLRSANVIEAINNAWLHQERNPDWEIRYRYLTTAKIGLEQGDLLGLSMAGLEVWERARRATDVGARNADAERLRQFLLQEQRISSQVQAFLRDSDASGVWLRLVSKVEWDTDAAEAPDVVKEIKDELVSWGAERHVPTVEAEKVTAHLYEAAWSVATRRDADRFLVRADAIRIFDEKTQTSLPQATLLALFDALTRLPAGQALVAAPQLSMIGRTNVIRRAPSLTARHFSRSTLIGNIAKRAQNCATVILYGSTGTGKSTLAAEFVAATTEVWGWVDLRGLETDALTQRLAAVSLELKDEEGIRHLVLDDFDVPADSRALESDLVALARILDARAGRLLFTSTNVLPQRLGLALGVVSESSLQVPSFSRDEIAAFLIARGCAPGPIAQQWAMVIELHTQGHAQLVHARVAGLESMEFPQPSALDLTETPPEVQGARAEARRLLALLDPAARDLLCRLSVTVQAMQRSQVISIATQDPPIDDPGLAFDGLVGPWIETIGENLYRVSPLVQNAGVEIHGQAWAKGAHRTIARGLLILRTLTPSDFSSILLHSTAARDWGVIGQLSIGTFTADKDTWFALAEMEGWFVLMSVGEGVSAPKTDPFGLFLIRLLQFRLAAAKGDQRAATAIIVQFNKELPSGQVEQPLQFCRQFFLAQILLWAEVGLSVAEMVNIGAEYVNLSDTLSDIFSPAFREIPEHALQGLNRSFDAASAAGFALSNRVNDRPSVNDFLGACEPLAVPLVRRLLWFIGGTDAVASLLFKRTWLWESRQQPPDWEAARLLCMRAYSLGRRWELPGLTQAAACAAAQIVDEQFGGLEEALRLADQLAAEIGWSPAQEDGRAAILLRNGNFTSALDIWRRILPDWQAQSEFDLQQQYSCRDAAIAAGRLDRWGEAADWLAAARERTDKGANPIYEAALLIDEGYARWKAGDAASALARLIDGLSAIDGLPPDETDEQVYLLRKRAGHTVMWMAGVPDNSPPEGFSPPPPACCSSMDPLSGPKVPSTPIDITWAHLLDFEYAEQLGDSLLREHETRLAKSSYGVVRVSTGMLRIRERLRTLNMSDLVQLGAELVEATELYRLFYKEQGHDGAEPLPADFSVPDRANLPRDLIFTVMINGVFALAARGAITEEVIRTWRTNAAEARLSALIEPWLALVDELFVTGKLNATRIANDASQGWERHIVASIKVGIDDTTRPKDLLTAHTYWAQQLPPLQTSFFPVGDIEYLVTAGWTRLSERPFLLRMPGTTVPSLKKALASSASGWRKVGEVLVAAENATSGTISEPARDAIRKLVS